MYRENLVLVDMEPSFLHTNKEGQFLGNNLEDVRDFEAGALMSGILESLVPLEMTGDRIDCLVRNVTEMTGRACLDPEVQVISFQNPDEKQLETRDRLITPIRKLLDSTESAFSFNKYGKSGIKDIDEFGEVTDRLSQAPKSTVIGVNRYLCVSAVAIEIKAALAAQTVVVDRSASLDIVTGQDLDKIVVAVSKNPSSNRQRLEEKYGVLMDGEDLVEEFLL